MPGAGVGVEAGQKKKGKVNWGNVLIQSKIVRMLVRTIKIIECVWCTDDGRTYSTGIQFLHQST